MPKCFLKEGFCPLKNLSKSVHFRVCKALIYLVNLLSLLQIPNKIESKKLIFLWIFHDSEENSEIWVKFSLRTPLVIILFKLLVLRMFHGQPIDQIKKVLSPPLGVDVS